MSATLPWHRREKARVIVHAERDECGERVSAQVTPRMFSHVGVGFLSLQPSDLYNSTVLQHYRLSDKTQPIMSYLC
jgi:hypothetical protein